MARQKQKSSSSLFGTFVIEGLALVIFVFLFTQARAERQKASGLEQTGFPVIQEMFQQTPFQDILAQKNA